MSKFIKGYQTGEAVVNYLTNLIFKKQIQKQKGIMKILPGDKVKAEEKAKFALQKLEERGNININNLKESDFEFLAENITNPIKFAEKTVVKSADIVPFPFKRSFADELAAAGKKGDFIRMSNIMKVDPNFQEVMKAVRKSKADEKAYEEMVGPKRLIPDRDVIPYQSKEVQKLSPKEKLARTTLTEDQYKDVLKKGKTIDDVIYAQDFYGDTAEDVIKKITEKEKFPFADGGVAGLLGERTGFAGGGMDRRTFIKIMGGIATLPLVGKFVKPAMPLIKKGAEITGPALDKLIRTVMSAGKIVSQSGKRLKELTTKKKLKNVEVEEDMMDGPSYTIKTKDKTIYYRPGKQDEMGIEDDIIEVVKDTVTKKASGGIARMLGE